MSDLQYELINLKSLKSDAVSKTKKKNKSYTTYINYKCLECYPRVGKRKYKTDNLTACCLCH